MVTANGNGTMFEVENKGTLTSPAIVEITPTIGLASVIINGLVRDTVTGDGRPIIIQNLTKNKMISIDGETGLITENGVNKIADVELYDLPSLLPGKNKIVTDEKNIVITIKFKPRYL